MASLWCFCPCVYKWDFSNLRVPETNRAFCELLRIDNLSNYVKGGGDTIRWRLLFPVIWHDLRLPPMTFLAVPFVFCALFILYSAQLVYERTKSYLWALLAGALAATSSPVIVSSGFLAYFDSALLFCIVAASFLKRNVFLWVVAALAPWIDERFIFALPVIAWIQWNLRADLSPREFFDRVLAPLWLGVVIYVIIRMVACATGVDTITGGYISHLLKDPHDPVKLLWGWWDSLRWGWLFVIASIVFSPGLKRLYALTLIPISLTVLMLSSGDYSRSMGVAFPMVLLGMVGLFNLLSRRKNLILLVLVTLLALANFITPAHHSFRAYRIDLLPLWKQWSDQEIMRGMASQRGW
jgi:hypothetical protein